MKRIAITIAFALLGTVLAHVWRAAGYFSVGVGVGVWANEMGVWFTREKE